MHFSATEIRKMLLLGGAHYVHELKFFVRVSLLRSCHSCKIAPPTKCVHLIQPHPQQARIRNALKSLPESGSVAIYKGAFYTRSKFTLKVLAEYEYAFLLLWENFK